MDSLQNQVTTLSTRVDALHRMIEHLSDKTAEVLSEVKGTAASGSHRAQFGVSIGRYAYSHHSSSDASMEHKDVLVDSNYPESDSQSGERTLSPEIQIQRLTAQLTAAYNRIAALEEQLLAQRIH
jgi:chaperonin cofactor prefoldin